MSTRIAPSLLSADFLNLTDEIEMLNQSEADWIHLDIMDGVFVPNISFGFPVVSAINRIATKPLDVHLMIINPDRYIQEFKDAGAAILSVHIEACQHLHRSLESIRKAGMKAGIVLNPHTVVDSLNDSINEADMVLIMSVNPGFGGQKFIENTLNKIARLKEMILKKNLSTLIEVDGGIDISNAKRVIAAGADILVAGNAIFKADNPSEMIKLLKS
ncbi:MAG: ribulose-phosphate 3-epimerase [Bacteroidales bacterium]|nr:ribulose-phosphate 3-epimerase [Bacteroidales bacterium]